MSTSRSIHLDVRTPDMGGQALSPGLGQSHTSSQPDAQARQRFEQALEQPSESAGHPPAEGAPQQSPTALFVPGRLPVTPASGGTETAAWRDAGRQIADAVEQLMVDEDSRGQRQVRMDLKDEVLPGVTVAIQQAEGRLRVDFLCRHEAPRLQLNAAAPAMAMELAQTLRCDIWLRVQTDDDEDPRTHEAFASSPQ